MSAEVASVEVLTAEVRTLMVGKRQVTLSVFRQLDEVKPGEIEPFGRVQPDGARYERARQVVQAVGRRREGGDLVSSRLYPPPGPSIFVPGRALLRTAAGTGNGCRFSPDGFYVTVEDDRRPVWVTYSGSVDNDDSLRRGRPERYISRPDGPPHVRYDRDDEFRVKDEAAEEFVRLAGEESDRDAAEESVFLAWQALPLIVLAGLR